jgi:transposase-like protein
LPPCRTRWRASKSYFPPFLEARKSSEKALVAVIQEAWIGGVSTCRVDDLVQAMGLSGISKSQVSKRAGKGAGKGCALAADR